MKPKRIAILGAGTGGTVLANRLVRHLPPDWTVTVVDPETEHLYQPQLLFLPFGGSEHGMVRLRARTLDGRVEWVRRSVDGVDADARRVTLAGGGTIDWDWLVIASGARLRPELTEGMLGEGWRKDRTDFYTLEGARALRGALDGMREGRLVIDVVEMPIKCPVAPLELAFLADDFFRAKGLRERIDITLVTPLDAAFTRPVAARTLSHLLEEKGIRLATEFSTGSVERGRVVSYDGKEIPFDLLVAVPTHGGAEFVEKSGFGNELGFVPTDPRTLAAKKLERVFVLGDATDVPASKAGSVAHFEAELLDQNLRRVIAGGAPEPTFDGHANCFVETGHGRALLIDFNYDVEPLPGLYPLAHLGPLPLLAESRRNHWAKLAFQSVYWHALLPGRPLPVKPQMRPRAAAAHPR